MKLFDTMRFRKPKQNTFNLSHDKKLTMNMNSLIPIMCQEVIPGDRMTVNTEYLLRLTPLQAPMYQRVKCYTHFFYIPYRILWNGWKDFITGGKDGTANRVMPYMTINTATLGWFNQGSLADYFGIIPTKDDVTAITNPQNVSALPFMAYQKVYNEYYRDSVLSTEVIYDQNADGLIAPGPIQQDLCRLRKRAWQKDFFTSARPWAQAGPEVLIPMDADIVYKDVSNVIGSVADVPVNQAAFLGTAAGDPLGKLRAGKVASADAGIDARIENLQAITNGSTTVSDLRKASRLQEWFEKNAVSGGRYIEQLLAHWGVLSSDARLQRPEYLGGMANPIAISEVLSSYQAPDDAGGDTVGMPQGSMAGHGISAANQHGFSNKRFEEHGVVLGLMSVIPTTGYQQGIPKMFQRFDKFEFPWPEFALIGEQQISMRELYTDYYNPDPLQGVKVFGYQSRYAEMKYQSNTTHGEFRNSLAYWHQNRIFTTEPALNQAFIEADASNRVFAVDDNSVHHLYVNLYNQVHCKRSLPFFSTPEL